MAIATMLWRDLRARLRDRSALVLGLFAPAALMTVFALAAGGPSQEHVPVGFAGPAGAALTVAIRDQALVPLDADGTVDLHDFADRSALVIAVESGKVSAGVTVGPDGSIEVLHGSDDVVANSIVDALASASAKLVDRVGHAVAAETMLGASASPSEIGRALVTAAPMIEVRDSADEVGGLDAKTQGAAGMATFFLFFTVQFGVLGLLTERRDGTLARLLVAPVAAWEVLLAKLLGSFVIGVASMTSLVLFAALLLDARWGSAIGVAVLVAAGVTAAVSTITLVVGLASTPDQAQVIQSMLALVLGLLGGSFFSLARAGAFARLISELTPHYWFAEGLVRLSGGGAWTDTLGPAAILFAFALVVGLPGLLLASRTVRP